MKQNNISSAEEEQIYMALLNIPKIKNSFFHTLKADTLKILPIGIRLLKIIIDNKLLTLLSNPNPLLKECFLRSAEANLFTRSFR